MREPSFYIGRPVRSLQSMLRVLSKTRSNQPSVVPDGIYGNNTVKAVSALQSTEKLPVTGITDAPTWERVLNSFLTESPLVLPAEPLQIIWQPHDKISPGERSFHLFLIQAMLTAIRIIYQDMPQLTINGIHDGPSVEAVKWFQNKCGRPETGIIDQNDWLNLTKLYRMTAGGGKII